VKQGTGMGLPLSKEFVRLMGGTLQVQSPFEDPARGTKFSFTITMAKDQSPVDDVKEEEGELALPGNWRAAPAHTISKTISKFR